MKKLLFLFTPPFFFKIIKIVYEKTLGNNFTNKIKINNRVINIPHGYPLAQYKSTFKLYDRFLPILVKHIDQDGVIIDIGANIGDTLFSIFENCKNKIECIEPSDIYYKYLIKNYNTLDTIEKLRVGCIKKFIGTGSFSGDLIHEHGTAHLQINNNKNEITQLYNLLPKETKINLIKVDTDGFDFDVLISGLDVLKENKPILFWENYIENDFQYDGFDKLYDILQQLEYDQIHIFDNYGNIITFTNSFSTLKCINDYLYNQIKSKYPLTFHYTDILASTKFEKNIIEKAINEYKRISFQ